MAWDLRAALLRKEEFESARLMDFEFRQRARTFRLLADELGCEPSALVEQIALKSDEAILETLAQGQGMALEELSLLYHQCIVQARSELIGERGDPTPHRLG